MLVTATYGPAASRRESVRSSMLISEVVRPLASVGAATRSPQGERVLRFGRRSSTGCGANYRWGKATATLRRSVAAAYGRGGA